MATTTGIYWCLVLTGCISLVVSTPSVVQYTQTTPTYPIVCPGDRLVLTCIVTGTDGAVIWKVNGGAQQLLLISSDPLPSSATVGSFFVNITKSNSTTVISTATNDSASVTLDGANLTCLAAGGGSNSEDFIIIDIANPPGSVNNVSVEAVNKSALLISWTYGNHKEEHCISYNINITANGTLHDTYNNGYNNYTLTSLIIGTNYSFIIIPIDTIGREGPPSSLIQYIWNVPAQVVNISWDQISNDSITIWWNNTQNYSTIPITPILYYVINVHSHSNFIVYTNNTNITITGLPLTDTNYTVTIIPVNIIGYGPSATVNVRNNSLDSSSSVSSTAPSSVTLSYTPLVSTYTSHTVSFIATNTALFTEGITSTYSIYNTCAHCSCTTDTVIVSHTQVVQSPNVGSIISVAIAVPITGLLTGLITSIITSIIVYCIMKNKGNKQQQGGGAAIYDLPIINKQQQQQDINTHTNTAYGHIIN